METPFPWGDISCIAVRYALIRVRLSMLVDVEGGIMVRNEVTAMTVGSIGTCHNCGHSTEVGYKQTYSSRLSTTVLAVYTNIIEISTSTMHSMYKLLLLEKRLRWCCVHHTGQASTGKNESPHRPHHLNIHKMFQIR